MEAARGLELEYGPSTTTHRGGPSQIIERAHGYRRLPTNVILQRPPFSCDPIFQLVYDSQTV